MSDLVIFSDAGIDDLFAIEFLIKNNYPIKAVVASAGNGCSKRAYDVLSYFFRNHAKIYLGKASNEKTHKIHEAIESLSIPKSKKYLSFFANIDTIFETPVKIISLAPLRDVATIIENRNIKNMLIMGGNYNISGNDNFYSEYNFSTDSNSARIVISSPIEKMIIPLDVTSKLRFTKEHLGIVNNKELKELSNKLLKHYFLLGENSIPLHDLTAVMFLSNPDCYLIKFRHCEILIDGASKGKLVCDEHRYERKKSNSMLAFDIETTPLHYKFVGVFK